MPAHALLALALALAAQPAPPPPYRESARPNAPLSAYVFDADYPAAALRNGEEGIVGVRLVVGPNGRVTACAIAMSSGSAALDSTTCRIMYSRARFAPARDLSGRPAPGIFAGRIRWSLPAAPKG